MHFGYFTPLLTGTPVYGFEIFSRPIPILKYLIYRARVRARLIIMPLPLTVYVLKNGIKRKIIKKIIVFVERLKHERFVIGY